MAEILNKKYIEQEKKMKAEAETKRAEWLAREGFNENEETYVYFPADSYTIKETLKDAGFRFSKALYWHSPEILEGYEDKVICIKLEEVAEIASWGEGHYIINAKEKVESAMKQARPKSHSEWIGQIGERIKDIEVTLIDIHNYSSKYGVSQIVKFETRDGSILKWFTTVEIPFEIGDTMLITATIKELINDKYEDGAETTVISRARLKAV